MDVRFRPIADIRVRVQLGSVVRLHTLVACVALLFGTGGCAERRPLKLDVARAQQCLAEGGFESRAPFGGPICQSRLADAGKVCTGKSDCLGQCLSDAPEKAALVSVGTPVAGRCEAVKQTFGCFGRVEGGKLAEPYYCVN